MSKPDAKRRYRRRRAERERLKRWPFLTHLPHMQGLVAQRRAEAIARAIDRATTVSFYRGMTRERFNELREQDRIPLTVTYAETQQRVANATGWLVCYYCDQAFPAESVTRLGSGSYMCGACIPF